MVRKGNLCRNGGFELGTTQGWRKGILYNLPLDFVAQTTTIKSGSYSGKITSAALEYEDVGYQLSLLPEEEEGYLMSVDIKKGTIAGACGLALGVFNTFGDLLRKGNITQQLEDVWRRHILFIKGEGNGEILKPSVWYYASGSGQNGYVDNFSLIRLKRIRNNQLYYLDEAVNVTANRTLTPSVYFSSPAIIRWVTKVSGIGGTSPTLDRTFKMIDIFSGDVIYEYSLAQITANGSYYATLDPQSHGRIEIEDIIGGTSPTFDIDTILQITIK